jgi:KDO2-lipid IV(A) lauroyltransferase
MAREAHAWRHRAEYTAVAGLGALVRWLPWGLAMKLGAGLGAAFYALDRPHRRLTIENLAAAFPQRTPGERDAIARGVFRHFGQLLVEILRCRGRTPAQLLASVEFEGEDRVRQAVDRGKGLLCVTGHFGFWELHALAHGARFGQGALVARPLDNPLLHKLLEDIRTSTGNSVIYRHRGLRRMLTALAENRTVAVLIDQHIHNADAVAVEFFDRPAATTSAVAALALRTGATILPVFALPLGRGRYRLIYEHPVEPPPEDCADPVRELTQRCTDVLEMYVRRYPELWLWMHRRWRDAGEAATPGMFPAAGAGEAGPDD